MFDSLELSMFVKQVFSEFEFIKYLSLSKVGISLPHPQSCKSKKLKEQLEQDKSSLLKNPVLKGIVDSFDGKIIDESINKAGS